VWKSVLNGKSEIMNVRHTTKLLTTLVVYWATSVGGCSVTEMAERTNRQPAASGNLMLKSSLESRDSKAPTPDVPEHVSSNSDPARKPRMYYSDTSYGRPFAKDPDVVRFKDKYLMYYSINRRKKGIAIGIAESEDLESWKKVGEILPNAEYERRGLAAPAALVKDHKVHLFYQTYGNGRNDAICHAVSSDGIHFNRNSTNPIFSPTGKWNCGRAIDAEVIEYKGRWLLYCATRDPSMKTQMLVVAVAPKDTDFGRSSWVQMCDAPVLKPELPWEKKCIEASALCKHNGRLFMFYAGAYNNQPQQIGCAVSEDGISWTRLSNTPLLPNGKRGEWNSSESGHPGIFEDDDGQMYLFFQGNNDKGASWYLSKMRVRWEGDKPYLIRPGDSHLFRLK
jgi:predicted GH43/DUF377 family glycosyl hydrolase